MSVRSNLFRLGNDNRIIELAQAGFGWNAIAGIFQDEGIHVSGAQIASRVQSNAALESKALPKTVVAAHIRAAKRALQPI